jgi:hypothetical protein
MAKTNLHGAWLRRPHLSVLLAILLCSAPAVPLEPTRGDSPWHRWKSIRLKVKSMPLVSGRVWMHLKPNGDALHLETETIAKFFGARIATTHTKTVMNRETGLPHSYVSWNAKRARRFTFDEKGYLFERLRPNPDNRKAPHTEWSIKTSDHFDFPVDADGTRLPVYDHYGMLLGLRRADLAKVGDEIVVHVATSDGPTPYRIRVAELRAGEVRYSTLPGKERRSSIVRQMRLEVVPADPDKAEEGFLNMKGETELWVEAHSKTLLRIGGRAPKIGKIALVLAEMG